MNALRIGSLAEIAARSKTREEFWLNLRDFLDGFYHFPRQSAMEEEPGFLSQTLADGDRLDAFLAAVSEFLSQNYQFSTPSWASSPSRTLRNPYFAFDSFEGRMFLLVDSPTAFRARNIFVTADALARV